VAALPIRRRGILLQKAWAMALQAILLAPQSPSASSSAVPSS
jgi:hypothetical protein